MKKVYNNPTIKVIALDHDVIATSGGVGTGSKVGRSYNSGDVSYKGGMMDFDFDEEF